MKPSSSFTQLFRELFSCDWFTSTVAHGESIFTWVQKRGLLQAKNLFFFNLLMTSQKRISTLIDFLDSADEIVIIVKILWLRKLIGFVLLTL